MSKIGCSVPLVDDYNELAGYFTPTDVLSDGSIIGTSCFLPPDAYSYKIHLKYISVGESGDTMNSGEIDVVPQTDRPHSFGVIKMFDDTSKHYSGTMAPEIDINGTELTRLLDDPSVIHLPFSLVDRDEYSDDVLGRGILTVSADNFIGSFYTESGLVNFGSADADSSSGSLVLFDIERSPFDFQKATESMLRRVDDINPTSACDEVAVMQQLWVEREVEMNSLRTVVDGIRKKLHATTRNQEHKFTLSIDTRDQLFDEFKFLKDRIERADPDFEGMAEIKESYHDLLVDFSLAAQLSDFVIGELKIDG